MIGLYLWMTVSCLDFETSFGLDPDPYLDLGHDLGWNVYYCDVNVNDLCSEIFVA